MENNNQVHLSTLFAETFKKNPELKKSWISYAQRKMKNINPLSRAETAEDIISNILLKVLEDKRKWDIKDIDRLNAYMKKTICSYLSNSIKKDERTKCTRLIINEDKELEELGSYKTLDEIDKEIDTKELKKRFIEELQKDEEAFLVYNKTEEGYCPDEITEMFPDLNIYYIRSRIKKIYILTARKYGYNLNELLPKSEIDRRKRIENKKRSRIKEMQLIDFKELIKKEFYISRYMFEQINKPKWKELKEKFLKS